ncbi:DNA-binding protein [Actinoplanes sp. NPDC051851]|uniref:helix-turn-helix transcriptional regulator n=1 Tax=Actinoplanes sp. NPDC051851 TaxID=3154753 RepID=UPI003413085D
MTRRLPLMGIYEIRMRLGCSRQRINQLASRPDFPAPAAEIRRGRVWLEADIEAWIAEHRPELARPVLEQ